MLERRKGSAPARTDQTPPNQRRVPRRGGGGRGGEIEGGKSSYLDLDRGAGSRLRCGVGEGTCETAWRWQIG